MVRRDDDNHAVHVADAGAEPYVLSDGMSRTGASFKCDCKCWVGEALMIINSHMGPLASIAMFPSWNN